MDEETRTLLKMRSIAMAMEPEQKAEVSTFINLIIFTLASETYGIESAFIKEVYSLKDYTPLPGVPNHILGIINVQGQITPVVDLKKFFNFPLQGIAEMNKVIILHDELMEFGILVDVVLGTKTIGIEEIKMVPHTIKGIGQEYLKGVTKDNLIVINAVKLLSDESIIVNDEIK